MAILLTFVVVHSLVRSLSRPLSANEFGMTHFKKNLFLVELAEVQYGHDPHATHSCRPPSPSVARTDATAIPVRPRVMPPAKAENVNPSHGRFSSERRSQWQTRKIRER